MFVSSAYWLDKLTILCSYETYKNRFSLHKFYFFLLHPTLLPSHFFYFLSYYILIHYWRFLLWPGGKNSPLGACRWNCLNLSNPVITKDTGKRSLEDGPQKREAILLATVNIFSHQLFLELTKCVNVAPGLLRYDLRPTARRVPWSNMMFSFLFHLQDHPLLVHLLCRCSEPDETHLLAELLCQVSIDRPFQGRKEGRKE